MVDKVENPKPTDEPRMTFNYLKVVEELPWVYIQLTGSYHDYLFNPRYDCYMTPDLKYGYSLVPVHPEDRKFFAFTIPDIRQFQPL